MIEHIDYIIFGSFLLANLGIGLYFGRQVKTLRDYAVGSGEFSTFLLAATIAATWTTGTGFSIYLSRIFYQGIAHLILTGVAVITLFFIGQMALRMGEFKGSLSVAEALGKIYGKKVRVISGLAASVSCMVYVGGQFFVGSKILATLFNLKGIWPLLIVAIIVTGYSVFGGIRSVVFTDLFQFVLMGLFIPMLGLVIYASISSEVEIVSYIVNLEQFSLSKFLNRLDLLPYSTHLGYVFFASFLPHMFQRILLTPNPLKARKAFFLSGFLWLYIVTCIACISLLLLVDNPGLQTDNLLIFVLKKYAYPGFKGIMAVGIMAIMMSTADSCINTASVMFANDILKPLGVKVNYLKAAHFSGIIVGILAVGISTLKKSLVSLVLLSATLYMPIVVMPLLLAILGFRTSKRVVLIAMLGGVLTGLGCELFVTSVSSAVPGMLANLVLLFAGHYLLGESGGWVGIKSPWVLRALKQSRSQRWFRFKQKLQNTTPFGYLVNSLPRKEETYFLTGLYVLTLIYGGFYFVGRAAFNTSLFHFLLYSSLAVNALIITYPMYPKEFKSHYFIAPLWSFGIGYLFFVVAPVLVFMSEGNANTIALFFCNIMIASLLLKWRFVMGMTIIGPILASWIFKYGTGVSQLPPVWRNIPIQLFFVVLMGSILFIALLRQQRGWHRQCEKTNLLRNEYAQTTQTLYHTQQAQSRLIKSLKEQAVLPFSFVEEKLSALQVAPAQRAMINSLHEKLEKGNQYLELLMQSTQDEMLHIVEYDLRELLANWKERVEQNNPDAVIVIQNESETSSIEVDQEKIFVLLDNLLSELQAQHASETAFVLFVTDTLLHYEIPDQRLGAVTFILLPENTIPQPLSTVYNFHEHMNIFDELTNRNSFLYHILETVYSHYGTIQKEETDTYRIILPTHLTAIRPKIPQLQKSKSAPQFTSKELSVAWEAESEFMSTIREKSYNLPRIQQAVTLMKKHHAVQQRKSGEPYYTHPLIVAQKVSSYTSDEDALIGALLHDVVEDTMMTLVELHLMFGKKVAKLVDQVTKLNSSHRKYRLQKSQIHSKLLTSMEKNAILIKLCDRLHNLETLRALPETKRKRIIEETKEIYLPLAKKHGFTKLTKDLVEAIGAN